MGAMAAGAANQANPATAGSGSITAGSGSTIAGSG
jgi:hypothetical protein